MRERCVLFGRVVRRTIGSIAVAGAAGLCPSAFAAEAPGSGGLKEIEVGLQGRFVAEMLPFDVPFVLKGKVADSVDLVCLQYAGAGRPLQVTPVKGLDEAQTDDGTTIAWQPAQPATWTFSPLVGALPAGTARSFSILVEALDAERYYRFRIGLRGRLAPAQLADLRAIARAVFDVGLGPTQTAALTRQTRDVLRRSLEKSLQTKLTTELRQTILADAQLRFLAPRPAGTPPPAPCDFLLKAPESDEARFTTDALRVLEAALDLNDTLEGYEGEPLEPGSGHKGLASALKKVRESVPLASLAKGLRMTATTSLAAADELAVLGPALDLLDATPEELDLLSRGRAPGDTGTALAETRDPARVDDFVLTYAALAKNLGRLRDWLKANVSEDASGARLAALAGPEVATPELRAALTALAADKKGLLALAQGNASRLRSEVEGARDALQERAAALDEMADHVAVQAQDVVYAWGSTTGNAETSRKNYVSADAGFAYSPELASLFPYMAANIYLRPVNKDAPLSQKDSFGRRFALTLGVTTASVSKSQQRADLLDEPTKGALLAGVGLRVTSSIRLGAGALVFKRLDPNPLIDHETVGVTPYFSASFDVDVNGIWQKLFPK